MTATLLVGNCSWTDPTLIACGRFYPPGVGSAEARLRYYATQFPLVEVDSTYYAPPSERNSRLWVERTPADFVFDVKAFALLTGHGARPDRLPGGVARAARRGRCRQAQRLPARPQPDGVELLWEIHRRALAPLAEAGKLGAVLFQFPPWFRVGERGREYLAKPAQPTARVHDRRRVPRRRLARDRRRRRRDARPARRRRTLLRLGRRASGLLVQYAAGRRGDRPAGRGPSPRPQRRHLGRAHRAPPRTASTTSTTRPSCASGCRACAAWPQRAATVHVLFNNNYEDYGVRNARQMRLLLDEMIAPGAVKVLRDGVDIESSAAQSRRPPHRGSTTLRRVHEDP